MTPARPEPEASMRVIVVGRAAPGSPHERMEGRLRADPLVELVRAREPLDAVGELTSPLWESGAPRTALIVMPGALEPAEKEDFLAALRRLAPHAPALGLNGDADSLDRIDVGALRALVFNGAAAPPPTQPQVSPGPAPGSTPPTIAAPTIAPASPEPTLDAQPDEPVLRAMLAGTEILDACIAEIRRRLGDRSALFLRSTDPPSAPDAGSLVFPVERQGVRFGDLVAAREHSGGAARSCASWLAHWLVLRDQHAQLRRAAFTDPLTGVWNRRYFDRFLPWALEKARESRHELSLLVFDVDNFKQFNDRFGHGAGDEILIETVRLIRSVIRPADRVARIGGDEFAVVFYAPEGPRDAASRHPSSLSEIVARFQRQVYEQRFPKLGAHAPGALSISGGMSTFPWDAGDAATLLARADSLALESKSAGKNTIRFGASRPVSDPPEPPFGG